VARRNPGASPLAEEASSATFFVIRIKFIATSMWRGCYGWHNSAISFIVNSKNAFAGVEDCLPYNTKQFDARGES